ncbi:MAG: SusC/RagA family TonB-linked outer membrane protein [Candidatus Symbiothrix sp.]|nr:SusC/RagA family TonB-linked outer membrane protein [Candidatus Symbiothrix sp.]
MTQLKAFCLTVILLHAGMAVYSQTTKLSIRMNNVTVKDVFKKIEAQSEYRFFYNDDLNHVNKKVDIDVTNKPVETVLDEVLKNSDLTYQMMDNNLIIIVPVVNPDPQDVTVSGSVTDATGETLPGVSIAVKGTNKGTISDLDGKYKISVPNKNAILTFSFLGYTTKEITVGDKKEINVILNEDINNLEEVVVIGYGAVKKRDLTGAVSSIKASDINLTAAASVGHALQGKVAGLSVMQNSAQPGGGLDILVRGAGSVNAGNKPLYIVDGFPITNSEPLSASINDRLNPGTQSDLNFINPNDIASIEVLKDASATAIYGSRAANGVVLITTKRGVEGKPVVSLSASFAVQKHTDIYDVFQLKEWMNEKNTASWDYWMFENRVYPYGDNSLEEAMRFPKNGVAYKLPYTDTQIENAGDGTDWIDLVTRDGSIEQYNLGVQGGSNGSKYLVSLNYFDHNGIIKNSRMQRYTGKINFDQDINKYFKMSLNLIATRLDNDNTPLGDGQWEKSGLIRAAVQMGPHIEAQAADGTYPINPLLPTQPNPYSLLEVTDNTRIDRLLANTSVTYEPIQNLFIKAHVGLDRTHQSRNTYMPKTTLYGSWTGGIGSINEQDNEQYLTELTANYNFRLNAIHNFGILGGYSFEKSNETANNSGNNNFITDGFLWNNLNAGEGTKAVGSSAGENKLLSYFGRVNYTLLDRYLFTATFRADGASVFARNHKWGYFPSVALAWNMADENFMASVKEQMPMLKWRVSYGQTGNSDIPYNAFAAYSAQPAWTRLDNSPMIGVFQSRLENPNLKWETTTELNIGLDVSLFKGIVSASFEYYNRVISDLLNLKALNSYHDVSFVIANIGKTQSRGFEFTLNTKNITRKNFSWTTDFTFTTYKDRWLERAPDWKPTVYEKTTDPIRSIFARTTLGILQTEDDKPVSQPDLIPGQIIVGDINGYVRDEDGNPAVDANGRFLLTGKPDGIIDEADTRLMGSKDPGFIIGLTNTIKYKGFDFNFNFYGMFDRVMEDPTRMAYGLSSDGISQYNYNALRSIKKRWMPNDPSTVNPSSYYGWSTYGYGDYFYEKAWFIRLQNISLGYTVSNGLLSKVISDARIHLDINNVLVITPYSGLDPETDGYAAAYPNARTFTLGFDLKF